MPISNALNDLLQIATQFVTQITGSLISIVFIILGLFLFLNLGAGLIKNVRKSLNNDEEDNDIAQTIKFHEEILLRAKNNEKKREKPAKLNWSNKLNEESYYKSPTVLVSNDKKG